MEFKCLGTGSSGNCYLLNVGGSNILLDAGVQLSTIVKNINLNFIGFAFISHSHKDHSLSAEKLKKRGIIPYTDENVEDFTRIRKIDLPNFEFYSFPVEHGDCHCAGLIIRNLETKECILYVTDFTVCKYDLSCFKFTSVIVECNYIKEKVIDSDNFTRTKENIYRHMSLEGCTLFLSKLDLSRCNVIILTHFSDNYSDPIYMGSYINARFRKKVLCCRKLGGYDTYE